MHSLRWLSWATAFLTAARGAAAEPRELLRIGDSITWGVVSGDAAHRMPKSWPSFLGPAYDVINAGWGGSSSLAWTRS